VTGILRDITERKRASEALGRLNEDLERKVAERTREREEALKQFFEAQKMESIGQLTGGLAHDFNNLLGAVLANLDLLRKRLPDEPKFRRLLDGAIHGAERGAAVTKRLLAFARRQELRPERVDIFDLVDGMGDLLQRSLGTEIQIRTNIPSDLPAVKIDANQLELALLNIAVNARDAMPFGGSLMISAISEGFIDNAAGHRRRDERCDSRESQGAFLYDQGAWKRYRPGALDGARLGHPVWRCAAAVERTG
jgi:signal transduction histidine kinase